MRLSTFPITLGLLGGLLCPPLLGQSPQQLAAAAGRALQNKDYATAEKTYAQLLKLVSDVAEMHSNHGMACYFQQKFDCAEKAFSRALALKQELFLPNLLLGQILFDRNEYKSAYPLVDRAYEQQPAQKQVRQLYAATLIGLKRYEKAIKVYQSSLQADPSDPDTWYSLGKTYLEWGQRTMARLGENKDLDFAQLLAAERAAPDESTLDSGSEASVEAQRSLAVNGYRDALSSGVEVRGVRVAYAKLEIAAGHLDEAREALLAEIQRDPWSYETHWQLARLALMDADPLGAVEQLDKAASIRPEFFDPLPRLHVPLEQTGCAERLEELSQLAAAGSFGAALLLGRFFESQDELSQAGRWSEMAVLARRRLLAKIEASRESAGRGGPEQMVDSGLDLLRRKRYKRGIAMLLPMLREGKLPPSASLELARALYRTARYDDLARLFRQEDSALSPELTYLAGSSLARMGLDALHKMVRLDPESARSHQVLGEALFVQERYLESAQAYESAVKRRPRDPEIYFLLGNSYYKQMLFPAAADAFERTIALDGRNAEAHLMLGDALLQTGDHEGAVAALTKSLDLNSGLKQAYVLLGQAYRAQGNFELALANLERGASEDEDGSIHYQLFMLYRRARQLDKAKAALETSQQLRQAAQGRKRPAAQPPHVP